MQVVGLKFAACRDISAWKERDDKDVSKLCFPLENFVCLTLIEAYYQACSTVNALAGVTFVNTHDSMVSQNNIDGSQNGVFLDAQSSGNTVTEQTSVTI